MSWLKVDPGRCPVDDAPHTTCTSPDYAGAPIVVQFPQRDGVTDAPLTMPAPVNVQQRAIDATAAATGIPAADLMTTATYRRKARR